MGPPVDLILKNALQSNNVAGSTAEPSIPCFDAFCFEPIPYRYAQACLQMTFF